MGRALDGIKQITAGGNGAKQPGPSRQRRAFVRILQFFALMVVLTIFARGAAGITMPAVTTAPLTQHSVRVAAEYTGTIVAANQETIDLPAELKVDRVAVSPGSTVEKGDELVRFDVDSVQTAMTTKQIALQELEVKLAELRAPKTLDDSAITGARRSRDAAQRARDKAGSQTLRTAQEAVDLAQAELDNALAAVETAKTARDNVEDKSSDAYKQADAALKAAMERRDAARAALAEAIRALPAAQEASAEEIAAAQEALDDAVTALADAEKEQAKAATAFQLEQQKTALEITKTESEISMAQKEIDKMKTMVGAEGVVTAPVDGTVAEVTLTAGAAVTETDRLTISTGSDGYLAEFPVPKEKIQGVKMGSTVTVELEGYYWTAEALVVGRGMPDESGNIPVKAKLSGEEWTDGGSVKVTLVTSEKMYPACVPVSAVRPDADGFYVLVLEERNTILGQQTAAVKVPVTVQEKDKEYAAIDGLYESGVQVVLTATKPVNDGDLVRMDEAAK